MCKGVRAKLQGLLQQCLNVVSFIGSEETVDAIKSLFKELEERQVKDETYYLPGYFTAERSYMFDISIDGDNIMFETRWVPNIEALQQIADHYKVGFTSEYEERGNMIFGRTTYENGRLTEFDLEPEDFKSYDYNEDEGTFTHEGEIYTHEEEVLELLLKKNGPEIPPDQFINR
jgi:hypothetical protein